MQRQSPAVSGSSSHQGAAKGMYSSVPDISPAPSSGSTERKLKEGKIDNLVAGPPKVNAVEKKNELHILKTPEGEMRAVPLETSVARSEHVVFAIPAPSKMNSPAKGRPPISSTSKAKAIQPERKSESLKVSSPSIPLVGSNQAGTKDGAMSGVKKRKQESMPSEGLPKKIVKQIVSPIERTNASPERPKPPKLQKRADEGIAIASSHGAEQVPSETLIIISEHSVEAFVNSLMHIRIYLLCGAIRAGITRTYFMAVEED